jgi:hypothetical protein
MFAGSLLSEQDFCPKTGGHFSEILPKRRQTVGKCGVNGDRGGVSLVFPPRLNIIKNLYN